MNAPTQPAWLDGPLNTLERHVRRHQNRQSILILLTAFVFCSVQFYGRGQILKKVPDKYVTGISPQQLTDFICDPAKSPDQPSGDSENSSGVHSSPQQTLSDRNHSPRRFRIYYATTEATTDVAFPFVYGTLLGILLSVAFNNQWRWTLLLPLTIVISDLTENSIMTWLSLTFDCSPATAIVPTWATWPTLIKWSLALLTALVVSYGLLKKLTLGSTAGVSKPAK